MTYVARDLDLILDLDLRRIIRRIILPCVHRALKESY